MSLAVGIDVGGTKLAAALVDRASGALLASARRPTAPARGAEAVLADCVALAGEMAAGHGPLPVGVGICETVDPAGRTTSAVTVDWRGRDVAAAFASVGPARVESDVRATAVAEARLGAGRGLASVLVVTVGTGISHCLVLDGAPWAGARGNAICTGAPLVEDVASGPAIARAGGAARAEEVLADPGRAAVVAAAADALGHELARLVNALDPAGVVIAGGLGLHEGYRAQVVAAMRPRVFAPDTARVPVVPAALGPEAAVIGAALCAPEAAA